MYSVIGEVLPAPEEWREEVMAVSGLRKVSSVPSSSSSIAKEPLRCRVKGKSERDEGSVEQDVIVVDDILWCLLRLC